MTTVERLRLTVIEELVDGLINGTTAANKLNLSVRQVKRLKATFRNKGHDGLIHGSRGRHGIRKININLENNIVKIINEKYWDFGPLLAHEKLQEFHQIKLGRETIRAIMIRIPTENSSNLMAPITTGLKEETHFFLRLVYLLQLMTPQARLHMLNLTRMNRLLLCLNSGGNT